MGNNEAEGEIKIQIEFIHFLDCFSLWVVCASPICSWRVNLLTDILNAWLLTSLATFIATLMSLIFYLYLWE